MSKVAVDGYKYRYRYRCRYRCMYRYSYRYGYSCTCRVIALQPGATAGSAPKMQ